MVFQEVRISPTLKQRAQLLSLPKKMQKKALRPAVSSAMSIINKQAKKEVPTKRKNPYATGQLKKSIGTKIKTYKSGSIWGGVSVRKGFKNSETGRNPSNYLHLVLFGRRLASGGTLERRGRKNAAISKVTGVRAGGRAAGQSDANDFLQRAADKALPKARQVLRRRLREKIRQLKRSG